MLWWTVLFAIVAGATGWFGSAVGAAATAAACLTLLVFALGMALRYPGGASPLARAVRARIG